MAELALHLSCLFVVIITAEASSSTFHHIQVGGPANQITTGEIRIDLPSESFQNIRFNITPYSLQSQYSPYYDQYSTGYKPSAYAPPKTPTYKTESPKPQLSYKTSPVVSYKPLPSIPHPVYSFPQPVYNQPQVSHIRPSYNSIQHIQPSYQPNSIVYSYKPSQTTAIVTKPKLVKVSPEGDYSAYPYPYQQDKDEEIADVVDFKAKEEAVTEKESSDRGGKILVIDADSIDPVTILPEFVPTIFEEAGLSTKGNNKVTPGTALELTTTIPVTETPSTTDATLSTVLTTSTSIRRRPVISLFSDLTTSTTTHRPTTTSTTTTTAPILTTRIPSPSSSIRRRPVISLFHDLSPSTSTTSTDPVTPPGDIGQTILDKIRTVTLTVESIQESDDEIALKTGVGNNEEELESEINNTGDEEKQREQRKIIKVRKPKTNNFFQEPLFAPNWQTGSWF